ncbi:13270_t:CDS:1, partial [Racocetra fulgida]
VVQKYIRIPLEMSPEPTSVAAISPTSNVFPHNLFPNRSSHETKRNGSLDLLVAAAVAINLRDSDYSNIE